MEYTKEDLMEKESKILNLMLWFFILGNFVNIGGYYVWDSLNKNITIATLVGAVVLAIIFTIVAFDEEEYKIGYGAFIVISFICSYIPYYLIVRYTGGSSFVTYAVSGMLYNGVILLTIFLNQLKLNKVTTSIIGIVATLVIFILIIMNKDNQLVSSLLGFKPDGYIGAEWSDIIKINSIFYICVSIIQYVAIFNIKTDSRVSKLLVLSFVFVLGASLAILLLVVSEGGAGDCADCGPVDCGSSGENSKRKRING